MGKVLPVIAGSLVALGAMYGPKVMEKFKEIESLDRQELLDRGIQSFGQMAVAYAGQQITLENCQNATVAFSSEVQGLVRIDHPAYGVADISFEALENYCPGFFSDPAPDSEM